MSELVLSALRREARDAPDSGIVEVFNYGRGRDGLIPLWAGEGDLPTPQFIADATNRSLAAGETFYTYQRGIPELRTALARYHEHQFGRKFTAERFFVTGYVRNPGAYNHEPDLTVLQAISLAGGLTDRGSDRRINRYARMKPSISPSSTRSTSPTSNFVR